MIRERFDILMNKYLINELNPDEFTELKKLVSSNKHYQLKFKEYVEVNILVEQSTTNVNSTIAFNDFLNTITKPKKIRLYPIFKYAAILTGVILSGLGINSLTNSFTNSNSRAALVVPNEDIILYEENGNSSKIKFTSDKGITNENQLEKINEFKVGDGKFYGISQFKAPIKTTNYTLTIPFGKKLNVVLSDGTKVYLNSGSSLTYPNTFKNSKNRVVKLQGEGYFEVVKNKKKPFIVKTNLLDVRVLGTKFNVSSYKNDNINSITLVEGKVAVSKLEHFENNVSKSLFLQPNERITIQKDDKKLVKKTVNNVSKYISWKDKELIFQNDRFIDIAKKLERNFNVNIISNNEKLNNIKFTGKFNKQDVFDILDAFRVYSPFTYSVNGNNIILKFK